MALVQHPSRPITVRSVDHLARQVTVARPLL